jgi:hypothetical protein
MAIVKKTANKSSSNIESGERKPVIASCMASIKPKNTSNITKRQQKALDNFLFGSDTFGGIKS